MNNIEHLGFNAIEHEDGPEGGDFQPLPSGNYMMAVEESEVHPNKAGTGEYIKMTYVLLDKYKGRKIFGYFNIKHQNETAEKIGLSQLAALCKAISVLSPKDTYELHNKPFIGRVEVKPAQGAYGPSNEVKGFLPVGAAVAEAPAQAKSDAAPWE